MQDEQTNRLNSLIKSDDFLDDNSATVAAVTQIPPLATSLKDKIQEINDAAAAGDLDLSGVAEDKKNKRAALKTSLFKISRAAAAYYQSANMLKELRIVDFNDSEIDRQRDAILYATAKEVHKIGTADVANLIGAVQADLDQLDTDKEAFFEVIQDPKREIEIGAVQNARIDPLINQGMDIRRQIDVFMQTLISTNEALYSEWEASMSIDDTGASNPPVLVKTVSVNSGETIAVSYAGEIDLINSSELKLINDNGAEIDFGFGADETQFNGTPTTVNANSQERKTAISLGFDSINATSLNVQNNQGSSMDITIEFYDMG